ncbi:hypothetical protein VTL71DRAFT_13039 [Oculimacula yallundae]|uniref:Uncharacterized protein n=1 Tax=Oculimacula yallundae TaxID=86028 RepID=A0ABR4CPP6_9HELO
MRYDRDLVVPTALNWCYPTHLSLVSSIHITKRPSHNSFIEVSSFHPNIQTLISCRLPHFFLFPITLTSYTHSAAAQPHSAGHSNHCCHHTLVEEHLEVERIAEYCCCCIRCCNHRCCSRCCSLCCQLERSLGWSGELRDACGVSKYS